MKHLAIVAGIVAGAAITLAGNASAAPLGGANAADAMNSLSSAGYTVQLNYVSGLPDVPLSQCKINGVHGLSGAEGSPRTAAEAGTVYLDVNCPEQG